MTYTVESITALLEDDTISIAFRSILINQLKYLTKKGQ